MAAPRKSALLHEIHGTTKTIHDRAADISHVPSGRPRFPKDLDPTLRPTFKRLCRLLQERRVLTAGDAELIRVYCFAFDRHTRQVAALREEGEICTYTRLDSNGQPQQIVKANLRLKIVCDAERQMASILTQLGLTQVAKDRAKPTASDRTRGVVPGSIEDLYPEMLEDRPRKVVAITSVAPEDMKAED